MYWCDVVVRLLFAVSFPQSFEFRPSVNAVDFVQVEVMEQVCVSIRVDHQMCYVWGFQAYNPCRFSTGVRKFFDFRSFGTMSRWSRSQKSSAHCIVVTIRDSSSSKSGMYDWGGQIN